jgi:hypothetical protein
MAPAAFRILGIQLFERGDNVRLAVRCGTLDLSSLSGPGFATRADPDWKTLQPMVMVRP